MLKTCLKHEWKASWKAMGVLNGAALFMGILGGLGIFLSYYLELPTLLTVLYFSAYVILLLASALMTNVFMLQRYYRNLFTDEGYLTNVLPVSSKDKIIAKLLLYAFFSILNGICILLSLVLLLLPAFIRFLVTSDVRLADILSYGWKQVLCVADASFNLFGIHIPALGFLYMILAILASLAFNILIFYACISIGSLFPNHKVLAAVLCFLGINTLLQFVAGFGIITIFQTKTSQLVLLSTSIGSLLFTIILCIVFYLICHYILDKRLNLS